MLYQQAISPIRGLHAAFVTALVATLPGLCGAQTASELMAQAERLGDQGNRSAAGPLYARAEAAFHATGDRSNEISARIGRLHRDEEAGSYSAVQREAERLLNDPLVQNDPNLRIRALALIGTIDLNLNTAAALDDWTQIRDIAAKIGDRKWENRANGQLGLVAGVSGNIGAAGAALFSAMGKAAELSDAAGYLHFATWLANGMATNGMADRAIGILDRAEEFAKKNGFAEMPLQLSIARVRALMNQPEPRRKQGLADASKLIPQVLAQAERERVAGAQTELLNAAGDIYLRRSDPASAEKSYLQAANVAALRLCHGRKPPHI